MRVIKRKNLPTSIPISGGMLLWLFMDRLHAPAVVQGIVWTLYGICFVAAVVMVCVENEEDIFSGLRR